MNTDPQTNILYAIFPQVSEDRTTRACLPQHQPQNKPQHQRAQPQNKQKNNQQVGSTVFEALFPPVGK